MKFALLADMMLFLAVVDNKSFTAAADEFNITKSVVSKRISRLEKSLGVQLLYRSTRKLSLSEIGKTLYDRCRQIKLELEEAELAITASHAEPRGILRINCPSSFGNIHLSPAIAEFTKLHPKIKVEMLLGGMYEDMIDSGIDIAIRIGELPDSSLAAKRLTVRRMRVCASPKYLDEHGTPQRPEDLLAHNCLSHQNSPMGNEWHFRDGKKDLRIPVQGNYSSSSSQNLEAAAVAGMGIVMLPGYMSTIDMQEGKLVDLLEEFCQDELGIHAVFPQSRYMAPKVRAFIDFIHERFSDENYWG